MLSTEALGAAPFAGLGAGNTSSRTQEGLGASQTPQPALFHSALEAPF